MKKLLIIILSFLFTCFAFADGFDDFKKQNNDAFESSKKEFSDYKEKIEQEFESYKKIVDEEFKAYKDEISKYWDTTEVSSNTKWVEYLNGYRVRKTVDFDTKEIKIDIIGGDASDIKPVLKDLLKEDKADAFHRDPVAYNTEKRLREAIPDAISGKIDDTPVVAELFSDKKLNDKEVDDLATKLVSQSVTTNSSSDKTGKPFVSMTVKLPEDTYKKSAANIKQFVENYAVEFKVDPALVMSVIYNESRFNPLAKSYVPAYGLMQIVPKSAGADAILFLEGKKKILAPSYLYNAENNVRIGAAYLHILYYKYFKKIENSESKLYCSIAAYNTGAGNVAYSFNTSNGGRYSIDKALPVINSMKPSEVYRHLKNNLKYVEARKYIVNVSGKMKDY